MSGPYQRQDICNCGAGRLRIAINCGILNVTVCDRISCVATTVSRAVHQQKSLGNLV